jgi:hypothetical protein
VLLVACCAAACTSGAPSNIHISRIDNHCRSGSPISRDSIVHAFDNIPDSSFDGVSDAAVMRRFKRYGGLTVHLNRTSLRIPGVAGKLAPTNDLPTTFVIFIDFPNQPPTAYISFPKSGPFRASLTELKQVCI